MAEIRKVMRTHSDDSIEKKLNRALYMLLCRQVSKNEQYRYTDFRNRIHLFTEAVPFFHGMLRFLSKHLL